MATSSPAVRSPEFGPTKRKMDTEFGVTPSGGSRRGTRNAARHQKQKSLPMTKFVSHCESMYRQAEEHALQVLGASDFSREEYRRLITEAKALYTAPVGEVFVSGNNEGYQLGLRVSDGLMAPKCLDKLKSLPIVQVVSGSGHNLARCRTGEVYSWGASDHGEIGRIQLPGMDDEDHECTPTMVTGLVPSRQMEAHFSKHDSTIVDVAAGGSQSLYLTIDGIVYMNGCYVIDGENYREMPPADRPDNDPPMKDEEVKNAPAPRGFRTEPRPVTGMPGRIKKIACGRSANAAIEAETGQLLTWGWDECGELGRGIMQDERDSVLKKVNRPDGGGVDRVLDKDLIVDRFLTPKPVQWPTKQKMVCLSVACGEYHLICAARSYGSYDSAAYSTGVNGHGQLGHGNVEPLNTLKLIEQSVGMHITQVAAGEYHSLFLDITGLHLWSCGRSDSGQLGITDTVPEPDSKVTTLEPVYFEHAIQPIVKIVGGGNSSMALTMDGNVYGWGFAQEGALGLGFDGESYGVEARPRRLEKLPEKGMCIDVALGSQHSIFLLDTTTE
jgi:alpha-tubulin suppressor-like RCC1 family protein